MADGDVAEGVDEAVLMKDVVCAHEEAELLVEGGWKGHGGLRIGDVGGVARYSICEA